jgi:nucleoside-diphosphate-sugar epimerase
VRIVITGASGFIGKTLCLALLNRGHEVLSLCRNSIETESTDLMAFWHIHYVMGEMLPKEVMAFSPEALVHLAWDGIPDFSERRCVENLESQLRFITQIKSLSQMKKVIGAGTCSEYGAKQDICFETDRIQADSYFAWAKQTLLEHFRISCQEKQIALVWFRIFYVYGPGQRTESLIPTLIRSYRSKITPDLKNPTDAKDYVYIDDIVNAFVKAIENPDCHGIINLGSGVTTTVSKVASIVQQLMQECSSYAEQHTQKIGDGKPNAGMRADIALAASQLAWSPQIDLVEGIKRTISAGQQ